MEPWPRFEHQYQNLNITDLANLKDHIINLYNSRTPLLALPAELRISILEYTIISTLHDLAQHSNKQQHFAPPRRSFDSSAANSGSRGNLSFINASRTIRAEGLEIVKKLVTISQPVPPYSWWPELPPSMAVFILRHSFGSDSSFAEESVELAKRKVQILRSQARGEHAYGDLMPMFFLCKSDESAGLRSMCLVRYRPR